MPTANAITLTANAAATDQAQLNAGASELITSTTTWLAQQFQTGVAVTSIPGVWVKASIFGGPTGTATIGIMGDSSNLPDGTFQAFQQVNLATLNSTAQWTGGLFSSPLTVNSNTKYHLVMKPDAGATMNSSAYLVWARDVSESYANGWIDFSLNTGSTWAGNSHYSLAFQTLSPTQVVLTNPKISSAMPAVKKIYEDVRTQDGSTKRYYVVAKRSWQLEVHFPRDADTIGQQAVTDLDTILAYQGNVTMDEYVWENKTYTVLIDDGSGKAPETEILNKVIYRLNVTEA